jgi:hypothetical protein
MTIQSRVFLVEDLGREDQPANLWSKTSLLWVRESEKRKETEGKDVGKHAPPLLSESCYKQKVF